MVIANITQQPIEKQDYDVNYKLWLAPGDAILTATANVNVAGLTIDILPLDSRVKLWIYGGVNGAKYKIELTVTTVGGRVKQDEINVRIREV